MPLPEIAEHLARRQGEAAHPVHLLPLDKQHIAGTAVATWNGMDNANKASTHGGTLSVS